MAQHIHSETSPEHAPPRADEHHSRFETLLGISSRYVGLLTAWIATSGSLFFSEVLGWTPCVLCWYQRILMYPLALIYAIGILRRDNGMHHYILPFSLLGACVSTYHYLLVKTDWLPPPPCTVGIPCTVEYLNWFGFINIPFLALTAFLIISFMAIASTLSSLEDANVTELAGEEGDGVAGSVLRWTNAAVFVIIGIVVGTFVIAGRTF